MSNTTVTEAVTGETIEAPEVTTPTTADASNVSATEAPTTTVNATTTTHAPRTTTTKRASGGGTIVYKTETGLKYHRDGCQYLNSSKMAITLAEAKAEGLEACKVCNPPQ